MTRSINTEYIPADSPFVLVVNHYDYPGLGAWWGASLVFRTVAQCRTREPREIHFCMAREWWYPDLFGRLVKQPLTRWLFGQLRKTYGMILLPPVLDREEFRGQGTVSVRRAVAMMRGSNPQLVGLSPEGRTGENLSLCRPPTGAGLFLLLLTHETWPCLPVGLYEDDTGRLTANFGPAFDLNVSRALAKTERDAEASKRVMIEIGRRLPERMWGEYKRDIQKEEAIP